MNRCPVTQSPNIPAVHSRRIFSTIPVVHTFCLFPVHILKFKFNESEKKLEKKIEQQNHPLQYLQMEIQTFLNCPITGQKCARHFVRRFYTHYVIESKQQSSKLVIVIPSFEGKEKIQLPCECPSSTIQIANQFVGESPSTGEWIKNVIYLCSERVFSRIKEKICHICYIDKP